MKMLGKLLHGHNDGCGGCFNTDIHKKQCYRRKRNQKSKEKQQWKRELNGLA